MGFQPPTVVEQTSTIQKKAAQHLVAASLQSRPTWTTGQRASLLDTRRFAKSQLLLWTAMPFAASNCKLADKMHITVTTKSSSSAVPFKSLQSPSHFAKPCSIRTIFVVSQPIMATSVTAPAKQQFST